MLVSVFLGELFEKRRLSMNCCSIFVVVGMKQVVQPKKPNCQAVDHCDSCNPGYYLSGTSCKALLGVKFHLEFAPNETNLKQKDGT